MRFHPASPSVGVRATRPNEYWHLDVTIIKLLDGTRVYLHAVIDNFSRRILAWKLAARLEPQNTCAVLAQAAKELAVRDEPATVVADSGVENVNGAVDDLIGLGQLRRVLAQVEVTFSNSMIEAFWRSLKHGWLFLNQLDTLASIERLVSFYVNRTTPSCPTPRSRGKRPTRCTSVTATLWSPPSPSAAPRLVKRAFPRTARRRPNLSQWQSSVRILCNFQRGAFAYADLPDVLICSCDILRMWKVASTAASDPRDRET